MLPIVPNTRNFPIQFATCPKCGKTYAVCRLDFLRPDLFTFTDMGECFQCLARACVEWMIPIQELHATRASNWTIHRKYAAAAG